MSRRTCEKLLGSLFDHATRTQTGIEGKPPPFIFHSRAEEESDASENLLLSMISFLLKGLDLNRYGRREKSVRSQTRSRPIRSVLRGSATRVHRKNCFFRMEIDRGRKHENFHRSSSKDASPAQSRFYDTIYVRDIYARLRKTYLTCIFPRVHLFIISIYVLFCTNNWH